MHFYQILPNFKIKVKFQEIVGFSNIQNRRYVNWCENRLHFIFSKFLPILLPLIHQLYRTMKLIYNFSIKQRTQQRRPTQQASDS